MTISAPMNGAVRRLQGSAPQRSKTEDSSSSGEYYDDESELDFESTNEDMTRIFVDAALFREALHVDSDTENENEIEIENEEEGKAGGDSPTALLRVEEKKKYPDPVRSFVDLVGRDLPEQELVATERLAKMAVSGRQLGSDILSLPGKVDEPVEEAPSEESLPEEAQTESASSAPQETVSRLSPEEIVNLLVNEFGPLTTSEEDEERFVAEMDGAYFQEIAILGVLHLTTHRLTFHATLLSTRPDLLPNKQIIKAGPVTIHRAGLLPKRRLWVELSHDMFSVFPSGKAEDRIRPIRTVMLSSIQRILPENTAMPRVVKCELSPEFAVKNKYVEFDTIESAREWRREMQGALYLYKHRRASGLGRSSEDESKGVRINIPLSRIESHKMEKFLNFTDVLSIKVSKGPVSSASDASPELEESQSEDASEHSEVSEENIDLEGRDVKFCAMESANCWANFGELVDKAVERERNAKESVASTVVVDFGELSFVEQREQEQKVEDEKEYAIRRALGLSSSDEVWYFRSWMARSVCSSGYFVVSKTYIGFWSKVFSLTDKKYRYDVGKVVGARPVYRYRLRSFGLALDLKEHRSTVFDFSSQKVRDEAIRAVNKVVELNKARVRKSTDPMTPPPFSTANPTSPGSPLGRTPTGVSAFNTPIDYLTSQSSPPLPLLELEHDTSETSLGSSSTSGLQPGENASSVLAPPSLALRHLKSKTVSHQVLPLIPKVINIPSEELPRISVRDGKYSHVVCLTIGSRGDVQPYIALGLELKELGHRVTIVTHAEYKEWIEGKGINHRTAGGDPGALMKLSVENKMFSPQFFKESLANFRPWLDNLLNEAWEQCKDANILLESPSAMAGVHIAEALDIPYFRCFTMPWTKTAAFPHPFLSPPAEISTFNTSTYILFDNVFWAATSKQINRWRKNTLHIGSTDMGHMAQSKIPFIYNFSRHVVPRPMDWGDTVTVSGYWFLDNPDIDWAPPKSLVEWMAKARQDGKAIVYIGFGSITVPDPAAMTRSIVKAVIKSGVRAIIAKGWSSRMNKQVEPEFEFPPECYPVEKIPHDWLFPQINAALHHGGAGTTGASLRAGIPTLIKPWFGDQYFWASRVQRLGAGMRIYNLSSNALAAALVKATTNRIMKERAASVGDNIRSEDGVKTAIRAIYTYLDRAGNYRSTSN